MDALTHAIEAYICRSTTKQTQAAALEAYGECGHKKHKDIAIAMGLAYNGTGDAEAAKILIAEIRRINAATNIPDKLPGIRKENISQLAQYADKEATPLYPVPKLMVAKEPEQFYYNVMEDTK